MPIYTVHGPLSADDPRPAPDRIAFVRDGFSWAAFIFGPFWLIWHRLWWGLLGYVLLFVALDQVAGLLKLSAGYRLSIMLAIAVLMGLEGTSLRRWTLSRRKWRQLDLVVADDRDAAERRFFERWTRTPMDAPPHQRGAPPPARPPVFYAPPAKNEIIGLFPEPGAPR